jgi:2-oxoisovalerate dehydrogenase E1 component
MHMNGAELSTDKLLSLYAMMFKIRLFEDVVSARYKIGEIPGFVHLYHGEEAIATGVCAALDKEDIVTSTHRGHGHAIAKGIPAGEALAELFGKAGGCNGGRGGSMHMYKPSVGFLGTNGMVGGGIGLAVGSAMALKTRNKKNVAVTFFGDGASNMGIFYESLNLASVLKLPVVFVCENNLYATATPLKCIAANPEIATRAIAFSIKGMAVDGCDVLAVYKAAAEAKERAMKGEGPTLIECKTYRYHGHHEGDQIYGTYRTKEELGTWQAVKDPIHNFRVILLKVYEISEDALVFCENNIREEINQAVEYAVKSPLPDPLAVEQHLFAEA